MVARVAVKTSPVKSPKIKAMWQGSIDKPIGSVSRVPSCIVMALLPSVLDESFRCKSDQAGRPDDCHKMLFRYPAP